MRTLGPIGLEPGRAFLIGENNAKTIRDKGRFDYETITPFWVGLLVTTFMVAFATTVVMSQEKRKAEKVRQSPAQEIIILKWPTGTEVDLACG